MKTTTKIFALILLAGATVTFTSCGDEGGDNTPKVVKDGIISSQDDDDLDPTALTGDVTADVTITLADSPWKLTGPLAVKSGATLTIEAGVTIEATAGGTNVYLVVETGGKIDADGTSSPITFTSAASNPRNGDWGGVLINGLAPISGATGATSTTEVLPLSYGGTVTADNSGVFKYVILEYTGARINGEKEFNGLTLYGVGSGSDINNIVINGGDDDGIEFFGGSVVVDNILVINARDDMFDWTQGYTGGGDNWFGIREDGFTAISEDPRGIEGDGNLDGESPSDANQSDVTIDGLTIYHGAATAAVEMADMIKVRRGSSATITNAMIALGLNEDEDGTGSFADLIDLTDSKGDAADGTSITYWYDANLSAYADGGDTKGGANTTTITANVASTGASASVFAWSGFTLPTITAASDIARQD